MDALMINYTNNGLWPSSLQRMLGAERDRDIERERETVFTVLYTDPDFLENTAAGLEHPDNTDEKKKKIAERLPSPFF